MKILALDAALSPFSVALDLAGEITSDRSARNDALETGLTRIARLLEVAKIGVGELDRIAVGIGPGSFTGIRIALSFAKALAYAANIPLVGISSYDVLTPISQRGPCLTVVSGRPGVICARFVTTGSRETACGPPANVFAELLRNWNSALAFTFIANTEDVFPQLAESSLRVQRIASPAAGNAALAIALLARHVAATGSAHGVAPDYGEMPAVTGPKAGTKTAL